MTLNNIIAGIIVGCKERIKIYNQCQNIVILMTYILIGYNFIFKKIACFILNLSGK